jgi:hypothetical protein
MRTWMLLLAAVTSAHAYEVDTPWPHDADSLRTLGADHGCRSVAAAGLRSTRTTEAVPNALGADAMLAGIGSPLIDSYPDASGDWQEQAFDAEVYSRCPDTYEKRLMPPDYSGRIAPPPSLGNTPELRIAAWLMRGAIREDDLVSGNYYDPTDAPDAQSLGRNRPSDASLLQPRHEHIGRCIYPKRIALGIRAGRPFRCQPRAGSRSGTITSPMPTPCATTTWRCDSRVADLSIGASPNPMRAPEHLCGPAP